MNGHQKKTFGLIEKLNAHYKSNDQFVDRYCEEHRPQVSHLILQTDGQSIEYWVNRKRKYCDQTTTKHYYCNILLVVVLMIVFYCRNSVRRVVRMDNFAFWIRWHISAIINISSSRSDWFGFGCDLVFMTVNAYTGTSVGQISFVTGVVHLLVRVVAIQQEVHQFFNYEYDEKSATYNDFDDRSLIWFFFSFTVFENWFIRL